MLTVFETVVVALVLLTAGVLLGGGIALGVAGARRLMGLPRRRAHVAQLARRRRSVAAAQARLVDAPTHMLPCYRPGRVAVARSTTRPGGNTAWTLVIPKVDDRERVGASVRADHLGTRPAAPRPLSGGRGDWL